jgi:hypothetical protein
LYLGWRVAGGGVGGGARKCDASAALNPLPHRRLADVSKRFGHLTAVAEDGVRSLFTLASECATGPAPIVLARTMADTVGVYLEALRRGLAEAHG